MTGPKARRWTYTHEFLGNILGANRKSVTLAAQSMQMAGLISYRRGTIQVVDRSRARERPRANAYAIVKERFDAFLKPPETWRCRALPELRRQAIVAPHSRKTHWRI